MTTSSGFDKAWMLQQIGGDEELLIEVARVFLDDSTRLKEQLSRALQDMDSVALHAAAHSMKSAVGNFGAKDAVAAAQALEQACKADRKAEYQGMAQTLQEAVDRLVLALREELANNA